MFSLFKKRKPNFPKLRIQQIKYFNDNIKYTVEKFKYRPWQFGGNYWKNINDVPYYYGNEKDFPLHYSSYNSAYKRYDEYLEELKSNIILEEKTIVSSW